MIDNFLDRRILTLMRLCQISISLIVFGYFLKLVKISNLLSLFKKWAALYVPDNHILDLFWIIVHYDFLIYAVKCWVKLIQKVIGGLLRGLAPVNLVLSQLIEYLDWVVCSLVRNDRVLPILLKERGLGSHGLSEIGVESVPLRIVGVRQHRVESDAVVYLALICPLAHVIWLAASLILVESSSCHHIGLASTILLDVLVVYVHFSRLMSYRENVLQPCII